MKFYSQIQVDHDAALSGYQYDFVPLSKFGFRADQMTSVTFTVQACNDAHVGLMENVGDDSTLYLIAIGGWDNTANGFHHRYQDVEITRSSVPISEPLLDCGGYTMLQVSWQHGDVEIRANEGGSWQTITAGLTIPPSFQVRDVGFTTGLWSTAVWNFNVPTYTGDTN